MVVSFIVSLLVFPIVLNYAKKHHIVDNPNARKLQRIPIPVLGGVVVYIGLLAGVLTLFPFMQSPLINWGVVGMTVMMVIGVWDDVKDLSATLRFLIETAMVLSFILLTDIYIDNLHGFWGIDELPTWAGYLLSIVYGVGLINAVNMIDGMDGYSSGYVIMASTFFGLIFWGVWSPLMVALAGIVIGALIPFFLHNVFGVRSKMFMGDGGSMMLGMLLVIFSFFSVSSNSQCDMLEAYGMSTVAIVLAVTCIPVFDTIRVMMVRILRGVSPFRPDKTHLHHLFIDMGFSHLGASLFILLMNAIVVGLWWFTWRVGGSIDLQMYVVVILGFLVTFGFYKFVKWHQNGGPTDEEGFPQGTIVWQILCRFGEWTHFEKNRLWRMIRYAMDGPLE